MRLIDADATLADLATVDRQFETMTDWCAQVLEAQPTVDAVPVVRCKDCKHKVTTEDGEYNPRDIVCDYWESDGLEETDFCSYGERRTDEKENI